MTIKYTQSEQRAIRIAENIKKGGTITAEIDKDCQGEHKYLKGEKMKTAKQGGAFAVRLRETLVGLGYSGQHLNNIMGAVKRAVDTGNPFSMNTYRKPAAKGAKSSEANSVSVKLTIKGQPSEAQVATMLRDAVNAEKFRESYAQLAAFIVDALDEFDGE